MRRAIRIVIDMLLMSAICGVSLGVTGNLLFAVVAAAAVGAYGCWCFHDGMQSAIEAMDRAAGYSVHAGREAE